MPIGRLIRKIQCHDALSISQPPRIGPRIGPSSIGTPRMAISRPIRSGPAARVMIVMPSGISMPPPRPCRTRKPISASMLQAVAQSTEPSVNRLERDHVEPLGAEPVGGPAGQRDHRGQRQRVGGHGPGDGRVVLDVELGLERRQRDVDDGDVEDRHDRAEDDHAGDLEDGGVDLVGVLRGFGAGHRSHPLGLTAGRPRQLVRTRRQPNLGRTGCPGLRPRPNLAR